MQPHKKTIVLKYILLAPLVHCDVRTPESMDRNRKAKDNTLNSLTPPAHKSRSLPPSNSPSVTPTH
jgi:hypothetical protein